MQLQTTLTPAECELVKNGDGFKCLEIRGAILFIDRFGNVIYRNRVKKQRTNSCKYPKISIRVGDERHYLDVHRLVALAFIPNPENKPQVNHKDGDKQNKCAENLEWCTHSENMKHAIATGLYKPSQGRSAKLDTSKVLEIKKMLRNKIFERVIAKKFKVSRGTISNIKRRISWAWVQESKN